MIRSRLMNHHDNNKQCRIGALAVTLGLYFIFSVSGVLYAYTDNITVSVVASGMYGANNICQYLHPLFCLIIKVLNPLLPTADVFTTLMHLVLLLGVYFISYAAIEGILQKPRRDWKVENYIFAAALLMSIGYFVLGLKLFSANYTVQTAAIIAEGIIVLFCARHTGKGRGWIAAGTTLIFAGFLGRIEAGLLFLPFIALELLAELVRSKDWVRCLKKDIQYYLPSLLLVVILLGTKWAFLQAEPFKSDADYNKYRTITEDYPMETYGVSYKDFSEVDRDTYLMVTHWNLTDTDQINTGALQQIAEVGSRNDYQLTKVGLKRTLQEMKRMAVMQDVHVMTLVILAGALTTWLLFAAKDIWLKLEALFSFLGGFVILFYFTFRGRALNRVWQCILIAGLTILVFVLIKARSGQWNWSEAPGDGKIPGEEPVLIAGTKQSFGIPIVFHLLLCMILYFGLGQVLAHSTLHAPISPLTARTGAKDSGYEKTFEDDSLYIWPGWYERIPDCFARQNKLPTQRVIDHNIAAGDWVYGQIYFRDFLQRIGAPNPALALINRPNTYLMEGQEELMLNYLRRHYGEDIEIVYSHRVNGKKAYRLVRHNTNHPQQGNMGE